MLIKLLLNLQAIWFLFLIDIAVWNWKSNILNSINKRSYLLNLQIIQSIVIRICHQKSKLIYFERIMMLDNNFVFSLLTKVYQTPIYLATSILAFLFLYFYNDILLLIKQWRYLSRIPGPPRMFPIGHVYCYNRKDKRTPQYIGEINEN